MAEGQISREAIESLPRTNRRAAPSTTVDTYVEPRAARDQQTTSSRIVSGLLSFTGQAVDTSVRNEKAKIDLDKITQQQRAIQGLDPTDDATKAGLRSYQIVNMRDQVLETNSELAKLIQENPGMTDEEYEIKTREAYSGLVSQYQPDSQLSEALGNRLQESQVQLHQIRVAAQKDHNNWLKQDALGSTLEGYREASGSIEELSAAIGEDGSLATEADAMGVTPAEYRNTLIQAAARDAAVGDGRILSALEKQEWASRDPRIEQAREVYRRKEAQTNAVKIGSIRGDIETAWKTRQANWEQTEAALGDLNARYPGSVTPAMVSSLKQQRDKISAAEAKKTEVQLAIMENLTNGDSMRVGLRQDLTEKEIQDGAEGVSQSIDESVEFMIEAGDLEEGQGYDYAIGRKLEVGRAAGIEMPEFKRIFSSLTSLDPSDFKNEEGIPQWANNALKILPKLNESDIQQYGANNKTRAFINNYNAMRESEEPDPRAWRRAWASTYGETNLTSTQQAEIREKARKEADKSLDRGFLEWATSPFTDSESVPDHIRNWVSSEANREASVLIGSGATDAENTGKASAERALTNFTRLSAGSAVNRSRSRLLSEAIGTDNKPILRPAELDAAFQHLVDSNIEVMQDNSALEGLNIRDIKFMARPGGLIMPVDKLGSPLLNRPLTMQEIGTQFREATDSARTKEALKNSKREAEEREMREKRAQGRGPAGTAR